MADPYIGEIRMVGFTFAPEGWANADGQMLTVAEHSALYSLYGTTYGGDGRNTFGLPDLRGRVPIHCGQGPGLPSYQMGWAGGYPAVTLTAAEIPPHTHDATVNAKAAEGDQTSPENHYWGEPSRPAYAASKDVTMAADAVEVGEGGGGQAHQNMQPYLTIRFCVALTGIYPSRP